MALRDCWSEPERGMRSARKIWLRPAKQAEGAFSDGFHLWDPSDEVECNRCGQIGPGYVRRMDGEERCKPKEN